MTMQYTIIAYAIMDKERDVFSGYEVADYRLLFGSLVLDVVRDSRSLELV
jgi:hypothetical protein